MARRIKMISPFEVLTGNLSGKQVLTYPTQNNSAWDAPDNKRSYATNYVPRYVGVQRADGTTFFVVKKRSAIKNSLAQKRAQAVLAAAKLYIDAIDRDETMSLRCGFLYVYQIEQGYLSGDPTSNKQYKAWLREMIERILKAKMGEFTVPGPYPTGAQQIILGNPWVAGSVPASSKYIPTISNTMLVKFWLQLAPNGMYFYVDGEIGVDVTDPNSTEGIYGFDEIVGTLQQAPNVLGLSLQTVGQDAYVKYGSCFLLRPNGTYVLGPDVPTKDTKYTLTDKTPTA